MAGAGGSVLRRRVVGISGMFVLLVVVVVVAVLIARPTRVDVLRAARQPLVETIVASGRAEPTSRVALGFESVGTVVSVAVSEGARVQRGEVLVQLDDASARATVEQARAALAEAEASMARLRGVGSRVAATDLRAAEIALEAARAREDRQSTLERGGATTAAALDEAVRERRSAETSLDRASIQSQGLARGGDDVRIGLAAREGAQAALRAAQAGLDRRALRAPFDGIVLARRVEPGQVVEPGAVLLELASSGPLEIVVNADESHLARLALGQRADVSAESYPNARFEAALATIAPSIDPLRGTVEVRLAIGTPPDYLRPDMTVSVEIETGRAARALVLPDEVVHDLASDAPWVWVVEAGRAERRELRLGLRGDSAVSIVSGIDRSTDVVRGAPDALEIGQRVRVRRRR